MENKERSKDPIRRVATITLSLQEAWRALCYDPKVDDEYLDADSYDDVYHDGYRDGDASECAWLLGGRFEGADSLFPSAVCRALEEADRQSIADQIGDARRDALVEAFEMISVPGEYAGEDEDGENVSVSVPARIISASVDTPNNAVTIDIENPEHLLNDVINGVGMFYPHEIVATRELAGGELKSYFLAQIGNYFEVYGERKPEPGRGRQFTPDVKSEHFIDILSGQLDLLSDDEIADGVISSVEDGRVEEIGEAVSRAARITARPAREIAGLARRLITSKSAAASARYKDMLKGLDEAE